ncbi:MAG: oxygen-independent coproporphyrinogen III oxidase [Blastocatellia bacterium]|nr:oxygen-independent coproporphyrinogen III oxidase [Blastocatellia bacterium]
MFIRRIPAATPSETVLQTAKQLVERYNRPAPRYTSYPTIPEWSSDFDGEQFCQAVSSANRLGPEKPVSLYLHIPFCESLCRYCACTTVITKNHEAANPYLERLKTEIEWIGRHTERTRQLDQIHLGGGTPTFLSPAQLADVFETIHRNFALSSTAEISIEIDPRVTTIEHLQTLRQQGVNRVSMGIQDFDPDVQQAIHRIQSVEMVETLMRECRRLGFLSLNADLIYGLPKQTLAGFETTLEQILRLRPDRIALFSYAHVPWMKRQQRVLEKLLPSSEDKCEILFHSIRRLTTSGYRHIGMDHFALETDELCAAQDARTLHRNFQGYTTRAECDLFGIGMSAISSFGNVYAQNLHTLADYYRAAAHQPWPTMRGMYLSDDDRLRRAVINRILCHAVVVKEEIETEFAIDFDRYFASELERLEPLEQDNLVTVEADAIQLTSLGRLYPRNVAMGFDAYVREAQPQRFSKTM